MTLSKAACAPLSQCSSVSERVMAGPPSTSAMGETCSSTLAELQAQKPRPRKRSTHTDFILAVERPVLEDCRCKRLSAGRTRLN